MKESYSGRRNARFGARWPLIYGTDELIAQGTLLDVSAMGCRMVGTMPVEVGMHLWLRLYPQHRNDEIRIQEARVTWARNHEFGIELEHLSPADHHWLMKFLDRAERRSTFHHAPTPLPSEAELSLVPLSLPLEG